MARGGMSEMSDFYTLNSLMASFCNVSEWRDDRGDEICSFVCNKIGWRHITQSEMKNQ